MGTTVSTNLGLIKPDIDESVREDLPAFDGWATQQSANADKIDSLFRASTTTPVFTFGVSGGGFTLGAAGFAEFKLLRFMPRMAAVFFRVYCGGAGFAAGTGTYQIASIAPAIDTAFATFASNADMPFGKAYFVDNSAVLTSTIFSVVYNSAIPGMFFRNPDGNVWSAGFPVTLGQDDRVSGYFIYPTAVT